MPAHTLKILAAAACLAGSLGASSVSHAKDWFSEGARDQWSTEGLSLASGIIDECAGAGGSSTDYACIDKPAGTCLSEHGATAQARNDCYEVARLAWTQKMNDAYREVQTRLKSGELDLLREEQASWGRWLSLTCRLSAAHAMGSGSAYALERCQVTRLGERYFDLKRMDL